MRIYLSVEYVHLFTQLRVYTKTVSEHADENKKQGETILKVDSKDDDNICKSLT